MSRYIHNVENIYFDRKNIILLRNYANYASCEFEVFWIEGIAQALQLGQSFQTEIFDEFLDGNWNE